MSTVAYFCMEFGLHEDFPIYAGGLGILAGDFIKSAHDLGRPVVGVGLRWARGYSRQRLGPDGVPVDEAYARAVPAMAASALEADAREWMRAFLEKRPARYPGQR